MDSDENRQQFRHLTFPEENKTQGGEASRASHFVPPLGTSGMRFIQIFVISTFSKRDRNTFPAQVHISVFIQIKTKVYGSVAHIKQVIYKKLVTPQKAPFYSAMKDYYPSNVYIICRCFHNVYVYCHV
jgi:hypothetical protein